MQGLDEPFLRLHILPHRTPVSEEQVMGKVKQPRRQEQAAGRGGSAKAQVIPLFLWGRRVVVIRDGQFVRPGRQHDDARTCGSSS
jgi:hypothetical protein